MMKKSLVYFWLVSVLALTGCASTPVERSLSPEHAGNVREAEVYVVVPQKELYALFPGSSVGAAGEFGLIGLMINHYENSKAYQAMKATVAPLAAATSDLNWGRDLEAELRKSKVFVDPTKIKLVSVPEGKGIDALVNSASKPWVVVINSAYYLDAWYRVLTIGSDVGVWKRGEAKPVHTFRAVYYSRPVTSEMEFLITGRMAPLWLRNHGEPLRNSEAEGAREVAALIKTALTERPSNVVTPADTLQDYVDWDRMQSMPRKAKQVRTSNERSILVDENGRFLSVFTDPTYSSAAEARRPLAPGMARVYLYQTKGLSGLSPNVYVNGSSEGLIHPKTYFALDVKPGTYNVALKYEGDAPGATVARHKIGGIKPVTVDAKAGERYFVRFEGYQGLMTSSNALAAVSARDSEAELATLAQRY